MKNYETITDLTGLITFDVFDKYQNYIWTNCGPYTLDDITDEVGYFMSQCGFQTDYNHPFWFNGELGIKIDFDNAWKSLQACFLDWKSK